MPRVPRLPQVESRPIGTPRVGADPSGAFGDGLGRGLQQLGAGVSRLGAGLDAVSGVLQQERERAEAVAVTKAEAEAQKVINTQLWDSRFGLMNSQGEEALSGAEVTIGAMDKSFGKIRDGLASDTQKELFELRVGKLREHARLQVERHVSSQIRVVGERALEARQVEALKTIDRSYDDPDAVALQMASVESAIRATAATNDEAKTKVAAFRSAAVKTAIDSALGGREGKPRDVAKAREIFTLASKDQDLFGDEAAKIEEQIRRHEDDGKIETAGATIFQASLNGAGWADPTKALQALQSLPPGKQSSAIAEYVLHQVDRSEKVRLQAGKQRLNELVAIYEQTGDEKDSRIRAIRDWMLDPENGAAELWQGWEKDLVRERRAARTSNAEARRLQAATNAEMLAEYRAMDPEDRAALDVESAYMNRASRTTRLVMKKEQNGTKEGMKKEAEKGASVGGEVSFYRLLANETKRAGIKPKSEAETKFRSDMAAWRLQHLLDNNGKEPTRDDTVKQISDWFIYVNPGFFKSNTFKGLVPEGSGFEVLPPEKQKNPALQTSAKPDGGGAVSPKPPIPGAKRIRRSDGKTGWWDGKTPLPAGVEVIDG